MAVSYSLAAGKGGLEGGTAGRDSKINRGRKRSRDGSNSRSLRGQVQGCGSSTTAGAAHLTAAAVAVQQLPGQGGVSEMQAAMTGYAAAGPTAQLSGMVLAAEWDALSPLQLLVPWCRSVLHPPVASVVYTPQRMWGQHSHRTAVTPVQLVQHQVLPGSAVLWPDWQSLSHQCWLAAVLLPLWLTRRRADASSAAGHSSNRANSSSATNSRQGCCCCCSRACCSEQHQWAEGGRKRGHGFIMED